MDGEHVIETVLNKLRQVVLNPSSYYELLKLLDKIVREDLLPSNISPGTLAIIDELQKELALIDAHQSEYMNSRMQYSENEISKMLHKYLQELSTCRE